MSAKLKQVSIIYKSIRPACGINIFNMRLVELLYRRGYLINNCNLAEKEYKASENTILHYVPSMWANDQGDLAQLIKSVVQGRLYVILHGIYTPHENCYLQETKCPELNSHMDAILSRADSIIALSESCMVGLRLWRNAHTRARFLTFIHPGVYCLPESNSSSVKYAFIGGVIRPKKDIMSQKLSSLLEAYWAHDIALWVHCSNLDSELPSVPLWRVSQGILEDRKWSTILTNSSVVLCPYETKIQCVSGLIAEAISVGKPVIATDFHFAREMKRKYPNYVSVEDDLSKWPRLTASVMSQSLPRPIFSTWSDFADIVVCEMESL